MTQPASVIVRVFSGSDAVPAGDMISPLDRGFTLADALFETIPVYSGQPFRMEQHLERMRRSADRLGILIPVAIGNSVQDVLSEGNTQGFFQGNCALRVTVSRGSDAPGLAPPDPQVPTLVVTLYHLGMARPAARPLSTVVSQSRRNEFSAAAGHKTVAFTDSIAELLRARNLGADDCVFLDTRGHICEGSASNVFLVDNGTLVTPALGCGALPGITRSVIMDLAAGMGLPVEERVVEREELELADEAFMTSSLREIAAIGSVDGRPIRNARIGGLTEGLARAYSSLVEQECGRRVDQQ